MKSPLLRGFDAPDVHLRLRKRLSRCTLDCGFQTPESPALRGFVGGLQALATAALYLVLKSNGLHRPKIRLKKFAFSPKPIPANIVKKLPSQRCSKPLFIALFIFSHKRPTFAFTGESGYTHSPFGERSHTTAHTAKQGPSGRGRYHYPRHELHVHENPRAGCQNGVLCRFGILAGCALEERRKPSGQRCAYARRCSEASRPRWAALLCLQFGDVAVFSLCAQYFLNVRDTGGITTLGVLCMLPKCRTAACQKGSFAAFCDEICQG